MLNYSCKIFFYFQEENVMLIFQLISAKKTQLTPQRLLFFQAPRSKLQKLFKLPAGVIGFFCEHRTWNARYTA